MAHFHVNALEEAARSTGVWASDGYVAPSRFGDIAMALVPAAFILMVATTLLLALL